MGPIDKINLGLIKIFGDTETDKFQKYYDDTQKTENLQTNINPIINWIIGIVGIIAVIVMIYGGVQYMTASGDASKVKKAKDIILYGIIGLIIAALAFAIVNFVLSDALGGGD